jgi:hypothetical protein
MKLGDVFRSGLVGMKKDGSFRPLALTVIRKPIDTKIASKININSSIVIASHFKWLDQEQILPRGCMKMFHSFNKNISWCNLPQVSLSESDMVDKTWCGGYKKGRKAEGVLMITLDHDSGMRTKGFFLTAAVARACMDRGHRLTIIDYGRGGGWSSELERVRNYLGENNIKIIKGKPDNNQKKLAGIMREHKLFVCTSMMDASPKTVSEALCRGLRVVLNKQCIGGAKYISSDTGCLLNMPSSPAEMWDNFNKTVANIGECIDEQISMTNDPAGVSSYYHSHWGLRNSSQLLATELQHNFPGYIAICYDELKKNLLRTM